MFERSPSMVTPGVDPEGDELADIERRAGVEATDRLLSERDELLHAGAAELLAAEDAAITLGVLEHLHRTGRQLYGEDFDLVKSAVAGLRAARARRARATVLARVEQAGRLA